MQAIFEKKRTHLRGFYFWPYGISKYVGFPILNKAILYSYFLFVKIFSLPLNTINMFKTTDVGEQSKLDTCIDLTSLVTEKNNF